MNFPSVEQVRKAQIDDAIEELQSLLDAGKIDRETFAECAALVYARK